MTSDPPVRLLASAAAITAIVLSLACGSSGDEAVNKLSPGSATMQLTSDAFTSGRIPSEYSCDGQNLSPHLSWQGGPPGTSAFVLIVDDPDAGGFVHWLVYDIPPSTSELPRDTPQGGALTSGAKQGKNSFGKVGYGGPCPPKGSDHRYRFRIFALDGASGLNAAASADDVIKTMTNHVLASGELDARFGH